MAGVSVAAMTAWISASLGHMSRRYTGWPSASLPSGSLDRSTRMLPASA